MSASMTTTGMKKEWLLSRRQLKKKWLKLHSSFITWLSKQLTLSSMTISFWNSLVSTKIFGQQSDTAGKKDKLIFKVDLISCMMESHHLKCLSTMPTRRLWLLSRVTFKKTGSKRKANFMAQIFINQIILITPCPSQWQSFPKNAKTQALFTCNKMMKMYRKWDTSKNFSNKLVKVPRNWAKLWIHFWYMIHLVIQLGK